MAEMSVDNSDYREHAVRMKTAHGRVGAKGSAVVRRWTLSMEAQAILFCPVDTGHLRTTIGSDFEGDGRSGEMSGYVTATANYAHFVEYGTSRMAPSAFLGPAFDRTHPEFIEACEQLGVEQAIG